MKLIQSQVLVPMSKICTTNNAHKELASHQNSSGEIVHICVYNGIKLLNKNEEACVTSIWYINVTNIPNRGYTCFFGFIE